MREAQTQLSRFDVAFNNLIQGVCFFDGTRRLILANRRYAQIYGLSPETIHPGTTLEEIVDRRYAAGTFPDMTPAEYLRRRAAIAVSHQPTDSVVELSNGQVISIHHRPMPDGGWVSIHEDITERRHAEVRLAHMARHDALTGLPNRVALMNAQVQHRHTIETGLRLALSRAEFELLFQPIVNAQTGILNRFEALVR